MKYILTIFCILILAGCSVPAEYDFDLSCSRENFKWDEGIEEITYACTSPFFNLLCVSKTVKYVEDERFCTTHDGKSVRIQIK